MESSLHICYNKQVFTLYLLLQHPYKRSAGHSDAQLGHTVSLQC